MRTISHFINGQSVSRPGAVTSPVYDPSTGQVQAHLEHGDAAILAETVAVAKAAQPAWAAIDPQRQARVLFKYKARGRSLPGHENAFFLWPTLIDHVTSSMKSYQDEIFGPVLQIVRGDVRRGAELPEPPSRRQRGYGLYA